MIFLFLPMNIFAWLLTCVTLSMVSVWFAEMPGFIPPIIDGRYCGLYIISCICMLVSGYVINILFDHVDRTHA